MKFRLGFIALTVFTIGLFSFGFMACGDAGEASTTAPLTEQADEPATKKTDKPMAVNQKQTTPQGWKTYEFDGWSISFPADWGGNENAGVWWPGEGSMDRGRPALSVHTGGTPLMPNMAFEDKVNSHMNAEPLTKEKFSSSGFSGLKCTWASPYGKKYLGVFVEEKVGGGVSVVHFVNCQAPVADFDKYKDVFEKIVSTYTR